MKCCLFSSEVEGWLQPLETGMNNGSTAAALRRGRREEHGKKKAIWLDKGELNEAIAYLSSAVEGNAGQMQRQLCSLTMMVVRGLA